MSIRPFTFECEGDQLLGFLHGERAASKLGAIIIVGGPQYRAGSHRQFVHLARALASAGVPCVRFDYRGMGDSDGAFRDFEDVGADIKSAVDALIREADGVEQVMLLGLCDAASAAWMYAHRDPRVVRLALFNPWVRSASSHAEARVRHYYVDRLLSGEPIRKILRGDFNWRESWASLRETVGALFRGQQDADGSTPYQERMLAGARAFEGQSLLILSGDDMTAQEFRDHASASEQWQAVFARSRFDTQHMEAANHTFSCEAWRDDVAARVIAWARED
ncbi:MAG: hydrolase 1, exosortase A system-associated [Pseudomonadota bacterium]